MAICNDLRVMSVECGFRTRTDAEPYRTVRLRSFWSDDNGNPITSMTITISGTRRGAELKPGCVVSPDMLAELLTQE